MKQETTNLLDVTSVSASGEGTPVATFKADLSKPPRGGKTDYIPDARAHLNVTTFTGTITSADIAIVATVNGADQEIGKFTQLVGAGAVLESIVVQQCPDTVKAVFTLVGSGMVFTAKVDLVRLLRPSKTEPTR